MNIDVLFGRYWKIKSANRQVQLLLALPLNSLVVNISARHVHLSQEHVEALFGPWCPTRTDEMALPGRLLRRETDSDGLVGRRKRMLPEVRALGPVGRLKSNWRSTYSTAWASTPS